MPIVHSKPTVSLADANVVKALIQKGALAQGKEVASFEKEMARFLGRKEGVAVSSGTVALHLALMGLGIQEGDEVMLPSYVCSSLLLAVNYVGAKPVLIDIDPDTFLFDPDEIKRKKTRKTKALILIHPFGHPLDASLYTSFGFPIIEDVATSLGARLKNKRVGGAGKITICSFYATKMMTTGEGGMLLCDSPSLAKKFRSWRSYDEKKKWEIAFNYKMTDFQAAMGRNQLKQLPSFLKQRNKISEKYKKAFSSLEKISLPLTFPSAHSAYHRFVIRVPNASKLIQKLNQSGIQARSPIYKPLHQYLNKKGFIGSDILMKELVSLPIYPLLSLADQKKIIHAVIKNVS